MTQDEIIKMARRAELNYLPMCEIKTNREKLMAFAKLIAEHERKACADLCDRFANRMMSAEECADAIRARGQA